jgi:hypothetical protein
VRLATLFGCFGVVLAATLRVRREVKAGKQVGGSPLAYAPYATQPLSRDHASNRFKRAQS